MSPDSDETIQLLDSVTNMIWNMNLQKLLNVSIHVDKIHKHLENRCKKPSCVLYRSSSQIFLNMRRQLVLT